MNTYKIAYRQGVKGRYPYGIRNKGGYILFFTKIDYYPDQDERYIKESLERQEIADKILNRINPLK